MSNIFFDATKIWGTGHTFYAHVYMTPGHDGWRGPVDQFSYIVKNNQKFTASNAII